jgi:hypothetical protein
MGRYGSGMGLLASSTLGPCRGMAWAHPISTHTGRRYWTGRGQAGPIPDKEIKLKTLIKQIPLPRCQFQTQICHNSYHISQTSLLWFYLKRWMNRPVRRSRGSLGGRQHSVGLGRSERPFVHAQACKRAARSTKSQTPCNRVI